MSGRAVATTSCAAARARAVGAGTDREHHEPAADQDIDRGEGEDRKSDARARLRGAVDVMPIEQIADNFVPPPFRLFWPGYGAHYRFVCWKLVVCHASEASVAAVHPSVMAVWLRNL
jgi:hypothetical protein